MSTEESKKDSKEEMAYWLQKVSRYFQVSMSGMQDFQEAFNKSLETIAKVFEELEAEIKQLKEENSKLREGKKE